MLMECRSNQMIRSRTGSSIVTSVNSAMMGGILV